MKQIRIDNQRNAKHECDNSFTEPFSKIMADSSTKLEHHKILTATWLNSPLGPMLAIADDDALYLLEFFDRRGLEGKVERLIFKTRSSIMPGTTDPLTSISLELESYFKGTLVEFKTPTHHLGSPFQRLVWDELMRIPYGQTRSYATQAKAIERNRASRAVANANGANQLAIVTPCHRIINSNGDLGGYGGGIWRKQWLIDHEKRNV
jgi:AraC family transcriptional regulator of adaptative response/methylated-DNA-[protein]-cysteine methyltransferase